MARRRSLPSQLYRAACGRTVSRMGACRLTVAATASAIFIAGCGASVVAPSRVAAAAGATTCSNSGFYVRSKVTGNKSVIYNCRFAHKLPACVIFSSNIATNATDLVQLLFVDYLGPQRPACLSWLRAAKARQKAAREAAQAKAYAQELSADAHAAWHAGFTALLPVWG